MADDLFRTQYDVSTQSKWKKFYYSYKILIYAAIFVVLFCFGFYSYYLDSVQKNKISISEDYVKAKVYLDNGERDQALSYLKKIIFENDPTYSTLSFFLILNENLIDDTQEILNFFNHLLSDIKYEKEIKNLLIYKRALFKSNFAEESVILEDLKPLLSSNTVWKPHALLLLGDYFSHKKENIKAIEFYSKILSIKNLRQDFYQLVQSKMLLNLDD
jgi:tetratricopeptide (TPR) repeat protein